MSVWWWWRNNINDYHAIAKFSFGAICMIYYVIFVWLRHDIETLSALLALCEGVYVCVCVCVCGGGGGGGGGGHQCTSWYVINLLYLMHAYMCSDLITIFVCMYVPICICI